MIDAINSVALAAPILRGVAEQISTSDSFAVNPDRVQKAATPSYISPYYEVDTETQDLVYEVRDTSTGKPLLKISSPLSQPSDTVSTYDSSAQIRNASQVLGQNGPANTAPSANDSDTETSSSQDAAAVASQKLSAFTSAQQAGNTNAGVTTFDEIV